MIGDINGSVFLCAWCNRQLDLEAEVVRAAEVSVTRVFGDWSAQPIEGYGVFFHAKCWRSGPRWRRLGQGPSS